MMEHVRLTQQEQARLQVLNNLLAGYMTTEQAACKRRSDNVPRRRLDSLNAVSLCSINVRVSVSKLSDYVRLSAKGKCHPL